jgi:hypothetical protein
MNEIGRKNAYRNVQTGQLRDSYNGSMIDPVKSMGNTGGLPPFQNDKNFNESNKRQSDLDNNSVLPDPELRDKVKNALSITSAQNVNN